MTSTTRSHVPGVVWMKRNWKLRENPFPSNGVAVLGGENERENGLLFRPEVQGEKVQESIEKFVLGAAYSGLKFGYLWSMGGGLGGDQRGFGKSSLLQYLTMGVNEDFGRQYLLDMGLEESDADEHPLCAILASFDMANARSLAAVFFEATNYACRFSVGDQPTLAARLHARLVERCGTSDPATLIAAVYAVNDNLRGRTLGPPVDELIRRLCTGDAADLRHFMDAVKTGARGRVSAANFLATFLLFANAAGVPHVLLGCDQLEDFAATSTTKQKRSIEVERFRDFVLELQPMADMLTVIVTLHPRAEQAIGEMWKLADLPDLSPYRLENQTRIVVLEEIDDLDRAEALLLPYLEAFRTAPPSANLPFSPFTEEAIEVLLERSNGKPRDLLRKAHGLIQQGSAQNWELIDAERAAGILDNLTFSDEEGSGFEDRTGLPTVRNMEDLWTS